MSDILIRPIASADIEHAKLIPVAYPSSFFLHLLIQDSYSCLVAISTDQPVAWASASLHKSNSLIGSPDPHIQLLTLGVLPEYQHRGLARRLVLQVIASLHRDRDSVPVPSVYTHVCTSNTAAQALYHTLGMMPLLTSDPAGEPYVARNIYQYSMAWQSTAESKHLFATRDAYVLLGKVVPK
ncbi:hypothetical protein D9757_005658 [Collybiopsis confluens]|uniref:N-acetyltransferase domain-containing protein n=1 Tax=Collybiopsis confluens TaxID=2823264 RepID=A0A8H5MCG5_9AGAR|nr:hypothetical protein D9757_005658 [Collybiopsis confluens]